MFTFGNCAKFTEFLTSVTIWGDGVLIVFNVVVVVLVIVFVINKLFVLTLFALELEVVKGFWIVITCLPAFAVEVVVGNKFVRIVELLFIFVDTVVVDIWFAFGTFNRICGAIVLLSKKKKTIKN